MDHLRLEAVRRRAGLGVNTALAEYLVILN
jgi:hypothetical protein